MPTETAKPVPSRRVPSRAEVLASPCSHNSLKAALRAFEGCDPVDALNDAALLLAILRDECDRARGR